MMTKETYVTPRAAKAGSDPLWDQSTSIHDWRNHVPEAVQAIWDTFTQEQRVALVDWAEELASGEEWD